LRQKYVIKTLGNIYRFQDERINIKGRIFLLFIRKILGRVLSKANFIDVCTPQFHDNYSKVYQLKNIRIIENSVNTDRFFPMDKDECKRKCKLDRFNKVVGYSGGFPSKRGAKELVLISRELVSKYPDLGIIIIGDDSEIDSLKDKAVALQTQNHIIFTGLIEYKKLHVYINCMDVGIGLDSEKIIKSVGNSSQKIRQYIACGVPAICAENTNTKIVEQGFAITVSKKTPIDLFEAISFWLDQNPSNSDRFRKKAYQFVKRELSSKIAYKERYHHWKKSMTGCSSISQRNSK
jgi:glycosyltransferase involved in cell wall biosynthesis